MAVPEKYAHIDAKYVTKRVDLPIGFVVDCYCGLDTSIDQKYEGYDGTANWDFRAFVAFIDEEDVIPINKSAVLGKVPLINRLDLDNLSAMVECFKVGLLNIEDYIKERNEQLLRIGGKPDELIPVYGSVLVFEHVTKELDRFGPYLLDTDKFFEWYSRQNSHEHPLAHSNHSLHKAVYFAQANSHEAIGVLGLGDIPINYDVPVDCLSVFTDSELLALLQEYDETRNIDLLPVLSERLASF